MFSLKQTRAQTRRDNFQRASIVRGNCVAQFLARNHQFGRSASRSTFGRRSNWQEAKEEEEEQRRAPIRGEASARSARLNLRPSRLGAIELALEADNQGDQPGRQMEFFGARPVGRLANWKENRVDQVRSLARSRFARFCHGAAWVSGANKLACERLMCGLARTVCTTCGACTLV